MFVFYHPDLENNNIVLQPEESRHCIKALRHREGDRIFLTDGAGEMAEAEVMVADANSCAVQILKRETIPARRVQLHLAVAPTKNVDRMEWLVEKAVEIGVERITFIICEHSERVKIDLPRMERIAISALKQSQTALLPQLEVMSFNDLQQKCADTPYIRYIAWCDHDNTAQLVHENLREGNVLLLIGPEGDFSMEEILQCKSLGFKEIKLGERRLRTETAALYGVCAIAAMNC